MIRARIPIPAAAISSSGGTTRRAKGPSPTTVTIPALPSVVAMATTITLVDAVPSATRNALAPRLEALIDERRLLWLARNRRGGLDEALGRLQRTLNLLRS